jgi:hypothetical protein
MKLVVIRDIIQWMLGKDVKTVRVNSDRSLKKWGLFSCNLNEDPHRIDYDMHVNDLLLKDVKLTVATHYSGYCGRIGYAEGKPVTELELQPDISQRQPLVYLRDRYEFRCRGHHVDSVKYMWLHPDGSASAIV